MSSINDVTRKIRKAFRIATSAYTLRALFKGCAAGVEHEDLISLTQSECVVDIGANRGQFALVCRKNLPKAMIYSFEPLQEPAKVFEKVFQGDPRVKLFHCAVGPEMSQKTIHVSMQDDSSSLLPISLQSKVFPGTEEKESRAIEMCPLNAVLTADNIVAPALLKIDVQGYEMEVLRGCESLLSCFEYVYIECSFIELYEGQALAYQVIDYLHAHGFHFAGVYNLYYRSGKAIQGDFLFLKSHHKGTSNEFATGLTA